MKLINKTARTYLIMSVIIFIAAGIMLFFVLTEVMNRQLEEKLYYNKEVVEKIVKYDYPLPTLEAERMTPIEKIKFPRDTIIIKDTLISHAIEGVDIDQFEKYRQLTAYETLQGQRWRIVTRNSLVRNKDFIWVITWTTVVILLLLLTSLWILNTRIAKKLWKPFYTNLNRLKNFSVQDQNPINLEESSIEEFSQLNESILSLTQKLQSDYNSLKEFSENASHEMQTPLAIMQSKIELLLQSPMINQEQTEQLRSIYQAGNRLSKLNKTLLLLAKVENQQFSTKEQVDIKALILKHLENYEDFILNKNIIVQTELCDKKIQANAILADTLLSNLLSNAIKHNIQNGTITITLTDKFLEFSNTGNALTQDPANLFNRFKKASNSKESLGLGLAIVKQICDVNGWHPNYTYKNKLHKISILF
ncbi:HAMP domain-containing histidine kinase [Flavobacteriaceae bacterium F08102]|nr:HAMP domain-containing histidine kinase [Flavobacteriaceae bacterium F08102]